MYPELVRPFEDVWKSLQYHIRHQCLIECVDPATGSPVPLKLLRVRLYGKNGGERRQPNTPELYEGENWFVLKKADPNPGEIKEVSGTQPDTES
jgi:hypothetical protein